jgi:hypothetical protein
VKLENVPLFGVGNKGKSPNVSSQERVNLFVEVQDDPESNGLVMYPMPGLTTFVNFGANPCRGLYVQGERFFAVNSDMLWEIAADGTLTNRGTLLTTGGRVDMSDNGAQLLIVDGTNGYILTLATNVFAQITDADFPASTTCGFFNSYFVVQETDTARFYISATNDGFTWDALDFAAAESDPDNLVRVKAFGGQIVLFGTKTTEFWGDSGAADFPFARIGASAVQWGLAARWSLCEFMGTLVFLGKNQLGAVQAFVLTGNQAQAISNPQIDYILSTYTAVSDATGISYMVAGHPFYQLNFPTPGETWIFDGLTKEWHRGRYGASGRSRGEVQANFLNRSYVSDWQNGKVYLLDQDNYTDDGQYIQRQFVSRHNKAGQLLRIPQLWMEMESGVGLVSGQGSNPVILLEISKDGGHTWSQPHPASLGAIGEYKKRAIWNRLGQARDWLFRFTVTDPVKTVFVAAWAKVTG